MEQIPDRDKVQSLLSHKRKRAEEYDAHLTELHQLRAEKVDWQRQQTVIEQYAKENLNLGKRIIDGDVEIARPRRLLQSRNGAMVKYKAAAEACKPLILDAIESKWIAGLEGQGRGGDVKARAAEKAREEYERLIQVSEGS